MRHALSRGRFCTTTAWNVSRFMGEVNSRPQFSFFFWLKTSPLEFVSRKIDIISKCWTSLNKGMNKVFFMLISWKLRTLNFKLCTVTLNLIKKKLLFILYCNFHWLVGWCWWITKETVSCGRSFLTITVFKTRVSQMTTGGNLKLVRLWQWRQGASWLSVLDFACPVV